MEEHALVPSCLYIVFMFSHFNLLCSHGSCCHGNAPVPFWFLAFSRVRWASCDGLVAPLNQCVSACLGKTQVDHWCIFEIPFTNPPFSVFKNYDELRLLFGAWAGLCDWLNVKAYLQSCAHTALSVWTLEGALITNGSLWFYFPLQFAWSVFKTNFVSLGGQISDWSSFSRFAVTNRTPTTSGTELCSDTDPLRENVRRWPV